MSDLLNKRLITPLPRLVGSRTSAAAFVAEMGDVKGRVVEVDGSALRSGAQGFADELVKAVIIDRFAAGMVIRGAPSDFSTYVADSATARGFTELVSIL